MGAQFITGTGTDIGKTWLSCALLRHWRGAGLAPGAAKPVLSGFDPAAAEASDAGQLLAALGQAVTPERIVEIAPWRFAAPLSPDMAAAREGRSIDFAAVVEHTRRLASAEFVRPASPLLVEGVGGVMVPLDEQHTVRDWIAASGLPAVVVAGSYLGSLSHTLTALAALREVGVEVTAVALNESAESPVDLAESAAVLARHTPVPIVVVARRDPAGGVAQLAALMLRGM